MISDVLLGIGGEGRTNANKQQCSVGFPSLHADSFKNVGVVAFIIHDSEYQQL